MKGCREQFGDAFSVDLRRPPFALSHRDMAGGNGIVPSSKFDLKVKAWTMWASSGRSTLASRRISGQNGPAMRLGDQEFDQLAASGESFRVERKQSMAGSAPEAVREAICAFANDLPGSNAPGLVCIGVRDDGSPTGLAITDKLLLELADIKTQGAIVPPPTMFVEKRLIGGVEVAAVTVSPSDSPPVRYNGTIHVRIGPRRGLASAQDERILNERRRFRNVAFDIQPLAGLGLDSLDLRDFQDQYLTQAFSAEVLAANERTLAQRLAATKMIAAADAPVPTVLGMFVLGKRPRDHLANFFVQFLRIDGTELGEPIIDDSVIDGTLREVLAGIDTKLKAHIRARVDVMGADLERRYPDYPLAALQQLARNAVMHRSYEATNAPVRITWFNDRIEMWNPGGPFGVALGHFGEPGVTDYRNPNLAEAMKVLGYVQRFGVGIASARRALKENGNPALEFLVEDHFIQAVVRSR